MIMLSNFLKIDIFVARNLSKMPKFMNALRPKNILNYVRILRLTFVFYWNKSNIFFMLKDIRLALGHVYYRSLVSFLSFILLIFSRQKLNLPINNAYEFTEKNKKANLICPWACFLRAKSKS